jgi:hypothetical protein
LFTYGQKNTLEAKDIYKVPKFEQADFCYDQFQDEWNRLGENASVKDASKPVVKSMFFLVGFLRWLNTTVQLGMNDLLLSNVTKIQHHFQWFLLFFYSTTLFSLAVSIQFHATCI